jgi:hypothetical protein
MDGKQVEATVAPARTVVAGGGVPDSWITAPNLEKLAVSAPGSEGAEVQEDVAEPEIATDGESPMPVASIAAQGEHLANRIAEVVRKTVAESLLPVPLSVLGIKLRGLFGSDVIEKTQWAGRLSLTSLVKSLQGPDLVYSPAAEGFVFDPARHDEPVHESVVERVKKTHPHLASLVDHLHYQFRLPLLAPSEYAIVFRILAEEARRNGYNLVQTAKAVRDASKTSGVQLSRPGINFILSRIHSSGYQVGEDSARTADELGRLYVVEVLSYCKQIGAELTATDEKSLKELILGEMSNPTLNSTATSESVVGTTQTTTNTTTAPVAESAP